MARLLRADEASRRRADRFHRNRRHVSFGSRLAGHRAPHIWHTGYRHGCVIGCRHQSRVGCAHRYPDDANTRSSVAERQAHRAGRAGIRLRPLCHLNEYSVVSRQPADSHPDVFLADRLRGDLHRLAQTRHTAEYCHWWGRRRCATRSWLDRGDEWLDQRRTVAVPDYFCLDTAAFLGTRHRKKRRVRKSQHSDVARHAR